MKWVETIEPIVIDESTTKGWIKVPNTFVDNLHRFHKSGRSLMVYMTLRYFARNKEYAWPSVAKISEMTHLCSVSIRRAFRVLERLGLIERHFRSHRSTTYRVYENFPDLLKKKTKQLIYQPSEFTSYNDYLASPLWKNIRQVIYRRDFGTCQVCQQKGTQVHHLSYAPKVMDGQDLTQLILLCDDCHNEKHPCKAQPKPT